MTLTFEHENLQGTSLTHRDDRCKGKAVMRLVHFT